MKENNREALLKRGFSELAIDKYSLAIEAVEQSRSWAKDYQRKQEILSDQTILYSLFNDR